MLQTLADRALVLKLTTCLFRLFTSLSVLKLLYIYRYVIDLPLQMFFAFYYSVLFLRMNHKNLLLFPQVNL